MGNENADTDSRLSFMARLAALARRLDPTRLVTAACLIDRSGGKADIGAKLISLAQVNAPAYPADQLPAALAAIPAVKPGSRGLAA